MSEDAITLDENRHINNASKHFILFSEFSGSNANPLGCRTFQYEKIKTQDSLLRHRFHPSFFYLLHVLNVAAAANVVSIFYPCNL